MVQWRIGRLAEFQIASGRLTELQREQARLPYHWGVR